jgi:hypothetical protein
MSPSPSPTSTAEALAGLSSSGPEAAAFQFFPYAILLFAAVLFIAIVWTNKQGLGPQTPRARQSLPHSAFLGR